jgi:acyl-CoA synthetase (AMP-forming)/AMP-acid ligase II
MWSAGAEVEDRVAIYSPNNAAVLVCGLGLMRAGATWVPVNPRNALDDNVEFMNLAGVSWLFYHSRFTQEITELVRRVPTLRHCICLDREQDGHPSLESFMALGADGKELDWADPWGNPDHLVALFPTGGTTGAAKAVRFSGLAWKTTIETGLRYLDPPDRPAVCLAVAPLTHAAGVLAYNVFAMGGTNVVMPAFDAGKVLANLERYGVTNLFLPPTAFYALLEHPDLPRHDYSSLRRLLIAAAPVAPDKLRRGVETFGPCICQCYGQAEAPMYLTFLEPSVVAAAAAGDHPERLASCGRATYGVQLQIMDDVGSILPVGEHGEIVARSTLVNPGYHHAPDATADSKAFGWHHTGDIGYIDGDGYVYIVDRKKDMIITGGFNVFSAEVEAAILELPQVLECGVIGVPDDRWGEAVTAVVVLANGESLTEEAVRTHCKARLGSVKAPKSVQFSEALPRTSAGKTDKNALRRPFWKGTDRNVH